MPFSTTVSLRPPIAARCRYHLVALHRQFGGFFLSFSPSFYLRSLALLGVSVRGCCSVFFSAGRWWSPLPCAVTNARRSCCVSALSASFTGFIINLLVVSCRLSPVCSLYRLVICTLPLSPSLVFWLVFARTRARKREDLSPVFAS